MTTIDLKDYKIDNILRFKRDLIQIRKTNNQTGEITYDYRVVIKLVNNQNSREVIHRYTEFMNIWRNCNTKTALDAADYIVPFLNYITFQLNEKELPSVQDLTFDYGAEYLSKYGEGKIRNTVLDCDRVISKFYYFLAERNMLNHINKGDFIFVTNKNGTPILQSPFKSKYTPPSSRVANRLHNIEEDLIFEFLYTAIKIVPQIALGVYFQIFGGLRISEVVNLVYSNISVKEAYGRNGMVVRLIKTNLRPDLKDDATTSPKKPRNQPIIPIGNCLYLLYKEHIKRYRNPLTDAVFIDFNGHPMSKDTYRRNFERLKKAFMNRLKSSNSIHLKLYSNFLNTQPWSTHIGRGIFSNILSEIANNATEIAVWRGDSSLDTALSYVCDSKKVERKLILNMNAFYSDRMQAKFQTLIYEMR